MTLSLQRTVSCTYAADMPPGRLRTRLRVRLAAAAAAVASTWRNPDLRRAEMSFAGAWTAEWAFSVGIGVFAFRHGGAKAVGIVAVLRMLPAAVAAPALTPYADRWPRERVLAAVCVIRAIATGVAALLVGVTGAVFAVYALSVVAAVAAVPFRPVHSALLPSLCRTPYELASANMVRGLLDSVSTLVGAAVAALLLSRAGVGAVFGASAGAVLLSAFPLLRVHPERATRGPGGEGADGDDPDRRPAGLGSAMATGSRAILRDRDLTVLVSLAGIETVVRGALNVFLVVVAIEVIGSGDSGVGTLTAAVGAGAVAGSVATSLLVGSRRLARWFGLGVALWGLPLALLAIHPSKPLALALLAVIGIGNALVDIGLFTLIARLAADEVLAQVFGALESVAAIGVAAGSLTAPLLIALFGVRGALTVIGLAAPAAVALCWLRLRGLDSEMTHRDREIELLRAVSLFAPLPLPAVEQLAQVLEPVTHCAGETVFAQGDVGDRYYVIVEGRAEVGNGAGDVAVLGPGEGFGEIALLRSRPRTATVRARTDLRLMALSSVNFTSVVSSYGSSNAAATLYVDGLLARYSPD